MHKARFRRVWDRGADITGRLTYAVRVLGVAGLLLAMPDAGAGQEASGVPLPAPNPARMHERPVTTGPGVRAPQAVPLPQRKPKPPGPVHPRDAQSEPWSEEEVEAAMAACDSLLRGLAVKYSKLPAVREGRCGTPAPIKVEAIGADPAIAISPSAVMSCPMAAALAKWVASSVQPAARQHLGAPVVRFQNFASYDCRNRYGDLNRPISEHALANALDIGVFEISTGERVSVLAHWNAVVETPPPLPERAPPKDMVTETEKAAVRHAALKAEANTTTVARKATARPRRTVAQPPSPQPPQRDKRSLFLRRVHSQACGVFGTVLGPEANAAHANHFHLDMAKRRHSAFCE